MGSRGSSFRTTTSSAQSFGMMGGSLGPINQQQAQNIANQAPNDQNTPVTTQGWQNLQSMNDSQLAAYINQVDNVQMPNFLSDSSDFTQKLVYSIGMNDKPLVLDDAEFAKFMQDNQIPQSKILTRSMNDINYQNVGNNQVSFTGQQLFDILKYSRLNYIGGKHGGKAYGAGTYLDMTGGGRRTGYGSYSNDAVLNPKYARPISRSALRSKIDSWRSSNPKAASAIDRATGGWYSTADLGVYALIFGYNVITDTGGTGYHNVIDRRALVWKKNGY